MFSVSVIGKLEIMMMLLIATDANKHTSVELKKIQSVSYEVYFQLIEIVSSIKCINTTFFELVQLVYLFVLTVNPYHTKHVRTP